MYIGICAIQIMRDTESAIVYFVFFSIQLLKKHTLNPEITTLYQFHAQKALFKVPKICNIDFWIENYPPPLALFQKFIRFGSGILPLRCLVSTFLTPKITLSLEFFS